MLALPVFAMLAFSINRPLFLDRPQIQIRMPVVHCCELPPEQPPEKTTTVGSKAYYEGFFTQPINERVTEERGDGTEQAVKFAASSAAVIALLFLGFMASNGLL